MCNRLWLPLLCNHFSVSHAWEKMLIMWWSKKVIFKTIYTISKKCREIPLHAWNGKHFFGLTKLKLPKCLVHLKTVRNSLSNTLFSLFIVQNLTFQCFAGVWYVIHLNVFFSRLEIKTSCYIISVNFCKWYWQASLLCRLDILHSEYEKKWKWKGTVIYYYQRPFLI